MVYIRETNLKKGGVRYQAEVRLKGMPKKALSEREPFSML